MLLLNIKSPCLNCEKRLIGCHGKCNSYKQYKSNLEKCKINESRNKRLRSCCFVGELRRNYG